MWRGGAGGGGRARRDSGLARRGRASVGLRWLPGEPVTTKGADGGGCGSAAEFSRGLGCASRQRSGLSLAGQYSAGGPGQAGGARCSAAPSALSPAAPWTRRWEVGARAGKGGRLGRGRGQQGRPRGAGTPSERPVEVGSAFRGNRDAWERGPSPTESDPVSFSCSYFQLQDLEWNGKAHPLWGFRFVLGRLFSIADVETLVPSKRCRSPVAPSLCGR